MPLPPIRVPDSVEALAPAFDEIRSELGIAVQFPAAVEEEAVVAAREGPRIAAVADLRDLPFVTIDPAGSRDLDQAVAVARHGDGTGFVVHYAIADVAAFVRPGGAIDAEARKRVVTVYLPDRRAPLHPPVLSEGAASLLPDEVRQAVVWRFDLGPDGAVRDVSLERATVRSRQALSYAEVQRSLDSGTAEEMIDLLAAVGRLRVEQERARGGVSLNLPDQVVERRDGRYHLSFRAPLPIEEWNAQISLMTGMAAADLMLEAGTGILRTLPVAAEPDVAVLQREAQALGVEWPEDGGYPQFIRSLDPGVAAHAALLVQAARLFRGAGYLAFLASAGDHAPLEVQHAAVASPYAHVTAPLRRLVDRFAAECALAAHDGTRPPSWVTDALGDLPELMADGRRREGAADGKAADVVEAAVLSGRIGDTLDAVVVRRDGNRLGLQMTDPAVVANLRVDDASGHEPGDRLAVVVVAADPLTATIELEVRGSQGDGRSAAVP